MTVSSDVESQINTNPFDLDDIVTESEQDLLDGVTDTAKDFTLSTNTTTLISDLDFFPFENEGKPTQTQSPKVVKKPIGKKDERRKKLRGLFFMLCCAFIIFIVLGFIVALASDVLKKPDISQKMIVWTSFTPTSTHTSSQTVSFTRTAVLLTFTHTSTLTTKPSPTPSATSTQTYTTTTTLTSKPTHISTLTPTSTQTATSSIISTTTNTITSSLSHTFTYTDTLTDSTTNSKSTEPRTRTHTPTQTTTDSQSETQTETHTYSLTDTNTQTGTITCSYTTTDSTTNANTNTHTYTNTNTHTYTSTLTFSRTNTNTQSTTCTSTITRSNTLTNFAKTTTTSSATLTRPPLTKTSTISPQLITRSFTPTITAKKRSTRTTTTTLTIFKPKSRTSTSTATPKPKKTKTHTPTSSNTITHTLTQTAEPVAAVVEPHIYVRFIVATDSSGVTPYAGIVIAGCPIDICPEPPRWSLATAKTIVADANTYFNELFARRTAAQKASYPLPADLFRIRDKDFVTVNVPDLYNFNGSPDSAITDLLNALIDPTITPPFSLSGIPRISGVLNFVVAGDKYSIARTMPYQRMADPSKFAVILGPSKVGYSGQIAPIHEMGHVLGFPHTDTPSDFTTCSITPFTYNSKNIMLSGPGAGPHSFVPTGADALGDYECKILECYFKDYGDDLKRTPP